MAKKRATKARKPRKWIQGAIKHPGALRKSLKVREGANIPAAKLRAAAKKGGTLGKRARLALTLQKLGKRKKKSRRKK